MDRIIEVTLRQVQWERAKGELRAFLATYTRNYAENANTLEKVINEFIEKAEETLDSE
jgi:hypothetical protein